MKEEKVKDFHKEDNNGDIDVFKKNGDINVRKIEKKDNVHIPIWENTLDREIFIPVKALAVINIPKAVESLKRVKVRRLIVWANFVNV